MRFLHRIVRLKLLTFRSTTTLQMQNDFGVRGVERAVGARVVA